MLILIVGDLYVKRFKIFLGLCCFVNFVFNIYEFKEVNYFGISGGFVNNGYYLFFIIFVV